MSKPRDSQRKKFWTAFRSVAAPQLKSIGETRAFVNEIGMSAWRKKFKQELPWLSVKTGITSRCRYDSIGWKFYFREGDRSQTTVLKNICHALQPMETAWHSREYCRIFLEAISHWMGGGYANMYREAFVKHGVKFTAKRVMTDEAKAKLRKRFIEQHRPDLLPDFIKELKKL